MKSISTRLTIWYALAVTLSAMVFMVAGRYFIERSYIAGIDQLNDKELEEIRNRMTPHLEDNDQEAAIEVVREHAELDAALFYFQVGRSHGQPIFTSSNLGKHMLPESVHTSARSTVVHPELGRIRVGDYQVAGYDVNIASSLSGLDGLFANLYKVGLGLLLVVFMISLAIGRLLSRLAVKPIAVMQETASRISAKNLSERISLTDTGDELGKLGHLLNTMFDRLERSFEEVRKFTADASHELKTPLSLIRLGSEKVQAQISSDNAELKQLLDNQLELIDSLNKVVDDLLILAKADAGSLKMVRKRINVNDLLADFAEDAEVLCENADLNFEFKKPGSGQVFVDAVWLNHVLFNLISNAIKFSPKGGTIRLLSNCDNTTWHLSLEDDGPGIPEEKLEVVFRRFYNEPDPYGGRGSGLGLSLCQGIIRLHEGKIWLSNCPGKPGLLVEFQIPLMPDA